MKPLEILRQAGLSVTKPRVQLIEKLDTFHAPVELSQILAYTALDRVTVYRTLKSLSEKGIVHSIEIGWKKRYELVRSNHAHHHHLTCQKCQKSIDIQDEQMEHVFTRIASEQGFTLKSHQLEMLGLCTSCRNSAKE